MNVSVSLLISGYVPQHNCHTHFCYIHLFSEPYWLMLSAADLVAVQCFALAAIYITHKTNGLTTLASFRSAQKRDLLTVVIAYELSAVFSVAFDALMRFGQYYSIAFFIILYSVILLLCF